MTKKELAQLEFENNNPPLLDTLYVVVSNRKHDSGYKMYKIYGLVHKGSDVVYQKCLSECSDVINFSVPQGFMHFNVDSKETNLFRFFLDGDDRFMVLGRLSSFIVDVVKVK